MEWATGGISGIVHVSDLSDAAEVSSKISRRGLLTRGLNALLENPTVSSLLTTNLSANEFTSLFSTACYGQASFIANEAGKGIRGFQHSLFLLPSFR